MNVAQFASRYATAFVAHLGERSERSLRVGYELGREAVRSDITLLDVAAAHNDALARALEVDPTAAADVVPAGSDFLVEVLSSFEMVRRGFPEAQDAAHAERRRARMLRRLSELLADESLAFADANTVEELLRLVAEHVLEVVDARQCRVVVDVRRIRESVTVESAGLADASAAAVREPTTTPLHVPLVALDGSPLGSIDVASYDGRMIGAAERELVGQIAQMAAAMVERVSSYS